MNSEHRSPSDSTEPQELFDAETLQAFERSARMISSGSPEEERREHRAAWRNLSIDEKFWQIGLSIVLVLSVCGIGVVLDFFHLPSIFAVILWAIIGATLHYSKFSGS